MRVRVCQLNHMLTVVAKRFSLRIFDGNGTIGSVRFLESTMAMEPICAVLDDGEAIRERLAGCDAVVANSRDPILIEWQN